MISILDSQFHFLLYIITLKWKLHITFIHLVTVSVQIPCMLDSGALVLYTSFSSYCRKKWLNCWKVIAFIENIDQDYKLCGVACSQTCTEYKGFASIDKFQDVSFIKYKKTAFKDLPIRTLIRNNVLIDEISAKRWICGLLWSACVFAFM